MRLVRASSIAVTISRGHAKHSVPLDLVRFLVFPLLEEASGRVPDAVEVEYFTSSPDDVVVAGVATLYGAIGQGDLLVTCLRWQMHIVVLPDESIYKPHVLREH